MSAAMLTLAGSAAFFNPLLSCGSQRPMLATARATVPLAQEGGVNEDYKANVLDTHDDVTRDAAPSAGRVVPVRPRRASIRPEMPSIVKESSDMLSHQAIMENFVRGRRCSSLRNALRSNSPPAMMTASPTARIELRAANTVAIVWPNIYPPSSC